jgi:hypothetical protein
MLGFSLAQKDGEGFQPPKHISTKCRGSPHKWSSRVTLPLSTAPSTHLIPIELLWCHASPIMRVPAARRWHADLVEGKGSESTFPGVSNMNNLSESCFTERGPEYKCPFNISWVLVESAGMEVPWLIPRHDGIVGELTAQVERHRGVEGRGAGSALGSALNLLLPIGSRCPHVRVAYLVAPAATTSPLFLFNLVTRHWLVY